MAVLSSTNREALGEEKFLKEGKILLPSILHLSQVLNGLD
jgi:hypothetical protein